LALGKSFDKHKLIKKAFQEHRQLKRLFIPTDRVERNLSLLGEELKIIKQSHSKDIVKEWEGEFWVNT